MEVIFMKKRLIVIGLLFGFVLLVGFTTNSKKEVKTVKKDDQITTNTPSKTK